MRMNLDHFLSATAVTALVVAGYFATVFWQKQRVADFTSAQLLDTSVSVQGLMQAQTLRGLEWETNTIAKDPGFSTYIGQALAAATETLGANIDSASIRDLLEERRQEANLDAVALLDATGHTLVTSGSIGLEQRDYSTTALLREVLAKQAQSSALWVDKKKLTLVTVTPVFRGTVIQALLLAQEPIDKTFLDALAKTAHTDVAVILRNAQSLQVGMSTLANVDSASLQRVLDATPGLALDNVTNTASQKAPVLFTIDDHPAMGRATALFDNPSTALLVTLVPAAQTRALSEALSLPLLVACVGILLLLLLVSIALRRL